MKTKSEEQPHAPLPWIIGLEAARNAPRCGAMTRRGTLCQAPAMANGRCRMHGGKSPGAPLGNQNALKHGRYTTEAKAERQVLRELLKNCKEILERVG